MTIFVTIQDSRTYCIFVWYAETEKGIFDAILKGHIDFESEPWPSVSSSAKDLVRKMLTKDPKKRITAAQVLGIWPLNYNLFDFKNAKDFSAEPPCYRFRTPF